MTPRRTRLVRVPDLHRYRQAIVTLCGAHRRSTSEPEPVVIVPTRSAGRQLRGLAAVTRDELYDHLHARLPDPPRRLTALERDVLAQAAARAAARHFEPPFQLRPGLVTETLRFYDHLRRHSQQVDRFEELINEALGSDELERGAERLRQQTRFLAETFREYERRVRASDGCDEHLLRERLIAERSHDPVRHVIVTVADWIADTDGLYIADFDLLARLPGLQSLDIVATAMLLGSGFHERLHNWWPGLEETPAEGPVSPAGPERPANDRPVLLRPPNAAPEEPWWTHRDPEEELVAIARQLKAQRRRGKGASLDRTAVVFKRPLRYLYLAPKVFGSAGIPYRASDALPLAAEPTVAALDLALEAVASDFTRDSLIALLRSPHFLFEVDGRELERAATNTLDRQLSDARYLGGLDRLEALAAAREAMPTVSAASTTSTSTSSPIGTALGSALTVTRALAPLAKPARASVQLGRLSAFWQAHVRPIADESPFASRERRARAAVLDTLTALQFVHAAHDDPPWTIGDLALAVRRSIEEQTFEQDSDRKGLHLLDDRAARYGEFDDIVIVGVVEPDWPERPRRNIFYPAALLKSLGWPSEKDRRAAADARFLDLLACASRQTTVSVYTLDDDVLVSRSMQLDEMPRAKLSSLPLPRSIQENARVLIEEALSVEPIALAPLRLDERVWAELRMSRSATHAAQFHGSTGPLPAKHWSVSALDTYLDCPFKFFAQHVLRLEEEPEDEEVMTPKHQGLLIHEIFERFFRAWQQVGHRAITPANLHAAHALFEEVVDCALAERKLPKAEAGLERTRLLGSPAAAGLGEAVMRMEAERGMPVVERLLEHDLIGRFSFRSSHGTRTISLGGKADRLDLLEDGTFRLIDYKLGWPPDKSRALQLPIYGLCAEQALTRESGRRWTLGEAAYVTFKGPKRVVPLFRTANERDEVLGKAQQQLVDVVDSVAAGQFPPMPDDVYRCESCSFASVCRKDYVGDV